MVPRALDSPSKTLWCYPREMRCWGPGSGPPAASFCSLLPWLAHLQPRCLTFSSREATLKARSVTLPAAQRAALEECSSFQMVSVSTCGGQSQGPHHPRLPTGARAHGWCPPHGQDPRGRELGRQCCLPSAPPPKGKASCIPQSQHDVSFPASVTSPARMGPALRWQHGACLPGQRRGHGVTWAGLGVWAWRGF